MDLDTVASLSRPRTRDAIPAFAPGDAFLAGGTALFSEPQPLLTRLIDLGGLGLGAVERTEGGIRVGATCTLAALARAAASSGVVAAPLFGLACDALWGSFKIQNAATVGGNLCLALPASPMAALFAALDGICEVWTPSGGAREVAALEFVTGAGRNGLRPGELLRAIRVGDAALGRPARLRQASLTRFGRSASLAIESGGRLTITAATTRPVRVAMSDAVHDALDAAIPDALLHDDAHGAPPWRRAMTHVLADALLRDAPPGRAPDGRGDGGA